MERHLSLPRVFLIIISCWTVFIALSAGWTIEDHTDRITDITLAQARSLFKEIVTTRYWNASHGGVYVPVTEQTQPNPYLDVPNREVTVREGRVLTLVNPAYMTRQLAELAATRNEVNFHITSLNPIRPGNAPQEWEKEALNGFSAGMDEYYAWSPPSEDGRMFFRFMAPLWTERPCLICHSVQGYTEGDLRGGISVSIQAGPILSAKTSQTKTFVLAYLSIWIVGSLGIFISFRAISKEQRERSEVIDQLQTTLSEVRTLKGLIPICASCKKIRDDKGYWKQIESYISEHSEAEFSHGICPECAKRLYPDLKING